MKLIFFLTKFFFLVLVTTSQGVTLCDYSIHKNNPCIAALRGHQWPCIATFVRRPWELWVGRHACGLTRLRATVALHTPTSHNCEPWEFLPAIVAHLTHCRRWTSFACGSRVITFLSISFSSSFPLFFSLPFPQDFFFLFSSFSLLFFSFPLNVFFHFKFFFFFNPSLEVTHGIKLYNF